MIEHSTSDLPALPDGVAGKSGIDAELIKARYIQQLTIWAAAKQAELDEAAAEAAAKNAVDTAERAGELALVQALHAAYISTSQSAIDRSLTRVNIVTAATGTIVSIYTALLGLVYALGKDGEQLSLAAIVPAIFLGLTLALVAVYTGFMQSKKRELPVFIWSGREGTIINDRLEVFMDFCFHTVLSRSWALHAGIVSLGVGIITLPIPFIAVDNLIKIFISAGGIGIVAITAAASYEAQHGNGRLRKILRRASSASLEVAGMPPAGGPPVEATAGEGLPEVEKNSLSDIVT